MAGTTHFINAIVQHKDLTKVAVIRICGPVSQEIPPFCDFPSKLAETIRGPIYLVHGGYKYDGTEKEAFDEDQFRQVVQEIKQKGISNIAIIGIFSPVRATHEITGRNIVEEIFPEATVSSSHEIGELGILQRENATILNECLKPLCKKTISKFGETLKEIGVTCPFYLTQNDGAIINSKDVMRFPVRTFASGSTNSMQGAAFLASKKEAIVIDIGGTTSDVGMIKKGFPRAASTRIHVAGVPTNFHMPDVISIGLGGGSYVTEIKDDGGDFVDVQVGPRSAGYNLKNEALIYSENNTCEGRCLTATDIAVSCGICELGNLSNVQNLDPKLVEKAKEKIHSMLERLVDKIKLCQEDIPVIIVGGGSILIDITKPFKGASELIKPNHFGVANAIGAALSKVSATMSTMVNLLDYIDVERMDQEVKSAKESAEASKLSDRETRDAVENAKRPFLTKARDEAFVKCCESVKREVLRQGAQESSLDVVEKTDSVLGYMPGQGLSIKIKIVGDIDIESIASKCKQPWDCSIEVYDTQQRDLSTFIKQNVTSTGVSLLPSSLSQLFDATSVPKDPYIDEKTGEWVLSDWDIECIALGCGIYGCGGGGSVHLGRIRALRAVREGKRITVARPEKLLANADPVKDLVFCVGAIGAPTVAFECGVSTKEPHISIKCLKEVYELGRYKDGELLNTDGVNVEVNENGDKFITNYQPKRTSTISDSSSNAFNVVGILSFEFAGLNALEPIVTASELGVPLLDADCMTRAFPAVDMFIPFIYGKPAYPFSFVGTGSFDEKSVLLYTPTSKQAEDHLRVLAIRHGCLGHLTLAMNKSEIMTKTAHNIVSCAWALGNVILRARLDKSSVIDAIIEQENGMIITKGKVVDVRRETTDGLNKGFVKIEGIDNWMQQNITIDFQNEYLVAFDSNGDPVGCVPDLISVVDFDTGEPITAEELRYGMLVAVILMPCCDQLRTQEALAAVGPQAFRYYDDKVTFKPFRQRKTDRPIQGF